MKIVGRKTPERLYHYTGESIIIEAIIQNKSIRFSSPTEFNDPFDCKFLCNSQNATKTTLKKFLRLLFQKFEKDFKNVQKEKLEEDFIENKTRKELKKIVQEELQSFNRGNERFRNKYLVSCFSEIHNDILMWSHYSNKHRGFCLQFHTNTTTTNPNFQPLKVKYSKYYPKLNDLLDVFPHFHKLVLLRKSNHWKYEKEWRYLANNPNEENKFLDIPIPSVALSGVIFGCKCPLETTIRISQLIKEKCPQVQLYKAEKSETKYSLDIKSL